MSAGQELGNAGRAGHSVGDDQRPVGAPVDPRRRHAGRRPAEPGDLPLQLPGFRAKAGRWRQVESSRIDVQEHGCRHTSKVTRRTADGNLGRGRSQSLYAGLEAESSGEAADEFRCPRVPRPLQQVGCFLCTYRGKHLLLLLGCVLEGCSHIFQRLDRGVWIDNLVVRQLQEARAPDDSPTEVPHAPPRPNAQDQRPAARRVRWIASLGDRRLDK